MAIPSLPRLVLIFVSNERMVELVDLRNVSIHQHIYITLYISLYTYIFEICYFKSEFGNRMNSLQVSQTSQDHVCKLAQAVECLLRNHAFVVKRVSEEHPSGRKGQVTWSKYDSVEDAWKEAKIRSGF